VKHYKRRVRQTVTTDFTKAGTHARNSAPVVDWRNMLCDRQYRAHEGSGRGVPEVVPADEGLQARADTRAAVVAAELEQLVHAALAVAEVRALRVARVDAEALRREAERLRVVREAGVGEHARVGEARDDHVQRLAEPAADVVELRAAACGACVIVERGPMRCV
jgi:hypothetical protein